MSPSSPGAGSDPALETLFLPFSQGLLPWPQARVLFLRARSGWPLRQIDMHGLVCEQGFRPYAAALEREGLETVPVAEGEYPLVLALPPRQRLEARSLLARAVRHAGAGGRVVAAMTNSEGARSGEADLARLLGPLHSLSKNKSRVFWAEAMTDRVDRALLAEWEALDAPRPILDGRYLSRPGLFAWDRIDPASALLAESLPPGLRGSAADLGAGWGCLGIELLARCPGITALDLYEAEARALEMARRNLAGARVPVGFHWQDVTVGVPGAYDVILSNPPFHQGRADQPGIGRAFISAAAGALRRGGRLWLVANRHLPYEQRLRECFGQVREVRAAGGFKVFEAVKEGA